MELSVNVYLPVVVSLSLVAGWLVNITADTLPQRKSFSTSWQQPLTAVGCALRCKVDDYGFMHTLRTLVTWSVALGLGWLAYLRMGMTIEAGIAALYAWFFLAVAIIDLEHRRVLNRMLLSALPVVALVILISGVSSPSSDIITPTPRSAIIGAAFGFGLFLLTALLRPGGMGMGDVKLAGLIGLATGVLGMVVAVVVGIIAGGMAAIFLLVRHRLDRSATMAYAPYLAFGACVAIFFGTDIWQAYLA